jgi:NTE family protein
MQRRGFVAGAAWAVGSASAAGAPGPAGRGRIGFALGSGALHGWAHIGIVRGCERLGLQPHGIAGCSVGAAVGALWAAGLSADEITRIARRIEWQPAGALSWLMRGRRRNDALRTEIDRAVGGRRIGELPIKFAAVASDVHSGESVVLDAGPAGLAVEASCAVPVWFAPVRVGSHELLDGSLTAPVPVEAARMLGADVIVAVDLAYRPYEEAPSGTADLAFQAMHILTNALAREQTRAATHLLKLDLHGLMRGSFVPQALIDAGEAAMMGLAPALRQK